MSDQLRDLLAKAACVHDDEDWSWEDVADNVLAARLPWLCPDCEGTGINRKAQAMNNALAIELFLKPEFRMSEVCTHPNAPTLADTVALWEAVHHPNLSGLYGAVPPLLAGLRAVKS